MAEWLSGKVFWLLHHSATLPLSHLTTDMLETRNLSKEYRMGTESVQALRGITFRVDPGTFVAVMGPSGAGKSTLLNLLCGLDTPTQGEILWDGQAITSLTDARRTTLRNRLLGIVFQSYHLLPELSAFENVCLPGFLSGAFDQSFKNRALSYLEQVGLSHRIKHRPRELSGGEQQRVAIARALVNQPRVLLCDEPTGNLDSDTGESIMNLLIGLSRRERLSLVLVTHEASFAARADRTIVLRDGCIVSENRMERQTMEEVK